MSLIKSLVSQKLTAHEDGKFLLKNRIGNLAFELGN